MSYRSTEWPYLIKFKPEQARRRILVAYRQSFGVAIHAAQRLGISHRSILLYSRKLGLAEAIEKIRSSSTPK